jgi:hypothetical protein
VIAGLNKKDLQYLRYKIRTMNLSNEVGKILKILKILKIQWASIPVSAVHSLSKFSCTTLDKH